MGQMKGCKYNLFTHMHVPVEVDSLGERSGYYCKYCSIPIELQTERTALAVSARMFD